MAQQAEDGGWHSQTYGQLRRGAATTALALYAIAHLPADDRAGCNDACRRGYAFLAQGIRRRGFVANPDGSLDYPTYGSAMTLVAADRLKLELPQQQRTQLVDFLVGAQLTETHDFPHESPHYGGWDLLEATGARGMTSGTNVSVSSFALEPLANLTVPPAAAARERARAWLAGCQNLPGDGGFSFYPRTYDDGEHKAQWTDADRQHPRSYGTATCDGLRALIYSGATANDPAAKAALGWLEERPALDVVPGFEDAPPELGWRESLLLYYYASLAKTLPLWPDAKRAERRASLAAAITARQHHDGRWQSDATRMREDDPLIATCLCLIALGQCANLGVE